jgi:hypothetical protein
MAGRNRNESINNDKDNNNCRNEQYPYFERYFLHGFGVKINSIIIDNFTVLYGASRFVFELIQIDGFIFVEKIYHKSDQYQENGITKHQRYSDYCQDPEKQTIIVHAKFFIPEVKLAYFHFEVKQKLMPQARVTRAWGLPVG